METLVGKGSNECILCNGFQVAYLVWSDAFATSNGKPRGHERDFMSARVKEESDSLTRTWQSASIFE